MAADALHLSPRYLADWGASGLDAHRVFSDARITVWRSIAERENGTLDFDPEPGRRVRWHVKRFRAPDRGAAKAEARGIELLAAAGIPTVPLVAWGVLADGRSFLISEDLAGYVPADRLGPLTPSPGTPGEGRGEGLQSEISDLKLQIAGDPQLNPPPAYRQRGLERIAVVAARLHNFGLHHRDLYLCHFLVHPATGDVRLIDAGRVKRLPGWPRTRRWVVKDLAQLHYSSRILADEDRHRLFAAYCDARGLDLDAGLMRAIEKKSARIARHDRSLKAKRPERDVSLPPSP